MDPERKFKSLQNLKERQAKIEKALAKADTVYRTIGTSVFNKHLNLAACEKVDYLDTAVRVGRIRQALAERAKPALYSQEWAIKREMANLQFQQAKQKCEEIEGFVKKGYLSKSDLQKAREEFEKITSQVTVGIIPPEVLPEAPVVSKEELEETVVLPDGQRVNMSKTPMDILRVIVDRGDFDNPVPISQIAAKVYPQEATEQNLPVVRKRIVVVLSQMIKPNLKRYGWMVVNKNRHAPKKGGAYYLAPLPPSDQE